MTVSSKALIPTAIFKSFRTAGTQRKQKVGGKIKPILILTLHTSQCSLAEIMVGMKPCSTLVKQNSKVYLSSLWHVLATCTKNGFSFGTFYEKLNYHQLQGVATGSTSDVS